MTAPLDVVTYGEAMAMFVADESGSLANVSHFTKRVAGAELNERIEGATMPVQTAAFAGELVVRASTGG